MSDDDEQDATRVGGAPPAVPKRPGAGKPAAGGEATQRVVAPPVLPGRSAAGGGAPSAAPAPAEGEETIAIGGAVARAAFSLQRIEPPGHAGIVYLTGETYLVGRKHGADLSLFSPTASREHARLERRADGWYLEPCADKTVIANGSLVRGAIHLEHKMRLRIGGDELIFFDESAMVGGATPAPTSAAPGAARPGARRWIVIAVALAAIAIGLAWWLLADG